MLIQYYLGKCEKCGTSDPDLTVQDVSCICKKCGKEFKWCPSCQEKKRLKCCGRRLENQMEWASREGVMF